MNCLSALLSWLCLIVYLVIIRFRASIEASSSCSSFSFVSFIVVGPFNITFSVAKEKRLALSLSIKRNILKGEELLLISARTSSYCSDTVLVQERLRQELIQLNQWHVGAFLKERID